MPVVHDTRTKKLTIHDIARMASVSAGTVSRVINDQPGVGEQTRARIKAIIEEQGYQASFFARNLLARRSFAVGLVFSTAPSELFSHPVYPQLMGGIGDALGAASYTLTLITVPADEREERVLREVADGRLDGVILPDIRSGDTIVDALRDLETPTVLIGHRDAHSDTAWVDCDHDHAIAELTRHLIAVGHTHIGLVNGPEEFSACALRAAGYRAALTDAGLTPRQEQPGSFSAEHGYRATLNLIDLPLAERPTAIVAASDVIAVGCIEAARSRGLRVPDDLAVTGFDDTMLARYSHPPLTTVSVPLTDMGHMAVHILFSIMQDKQARPRTMVLPGEVIVRPSSGVSRRLLQ